MVGGLATTKLGEESLRRFAKEAFVKENLPYIMGTISLLAMILATAVSSATAAGMGTVTFASMGSGISYSSFGWSGYGSGHYIGTPWPDGIYYYRGGYYHGGSRYSSWPKEPLMGRDLYFWTPAVTMSSRYSLGWYNQNPVATDLSPDKTGPVTTGSSVTWTAGATDPDGDAILYKFWLRGPSTGGTWQDMTGWTATNRWTWRTTISDAGTSSVSVSVKDGRHAGSDGSRSRLTRDYAVTLPRSNEPPTATGLAPSPGSPQVAGASVTWTATADDPDSDQISYRFWLKGPATGNSWQDMTGWTGDHRWTMHTTSSDVGTNQANVWVRDGNHAGTDGWDSYQVRDFSVTAPNSNEPPTATGLVPNLASPQVAGSSVTWTATATDPDSDQIFYRFWLKGPSTGNEWSDATGWTASNLWTWLTSGSDVGTSQVNVWIRDGNHAASDGWDSYQVSEFTVIGSAPATNQPPTALGISPDRYSPSSPGTTIVWTAGATDPDGDQIYYRFWLKGPSTGGSWQDMTGWTTNNQWAWSTTESEIGTSQANVWIRDGNHAASDGWDSYQVSDYTIAW